MGARVSCLSAYNDADVESLACIENKRQHDANHEQHVDKEPVYENKSVYPFPEDLAEINR
jgi:hypothetical protein